MPEMREIYKKHAGNYDELVNAEDHKNNIAEFLSTTINWSDKVVYEAGIGTGRVTRMYIDSAKRCYGFDRENHMLEQCQLNLNSYANKLKLEVADNLDLTKIDEGVDVFIEGWSFGHTMSDSGTDYKSVFGKIYDGISSQMESRGVFVIMETLGTNVTEPSVPGKSLENFYRLLEEEYAFTRHTIETDYSFSTVKEAVRVMGFFFGEKMAADIRSSKLSVIPEFTGVWIKEI